MTIGSWPLGCPELVESSGVIHGIGAGSSGTSAKAILQAGILTGLTLGSSSSSGHLRITLGSEFPLHQSAEGGGREGDASRHNNDVVGGGSRSMADADGCADEYIQGGVQRN